MEDKSESERIEQWVWSRTALVSAEDEWEKRLEFLPPGSWVILRRSDRKRLLLRAYIDEELAFKLHREFGGKCRPLPVNEWQKALRQQTRVLSIRGKLLICSDPKAFEEFRRSSSFPPAIYIPASLAFGTGNHPTTSRCLRLLADLCPKFTNQPFHVADVGCGSGILSIAAKFLGANTVESLDYDPICIRETRHNAYRNGVELERVLLADLQEWEPMRPCNLILANLLSETLIGGAEKLASSLAPEGILIFSGVMRWQIEEVTEAFRKQGLKVTHANSRGKWVTALAKKQEK
ncbi:MAG: 50S ribosomal protein L11 methyltransferase [Chthoniobacterales bacterium]|nr:50S ribosomal protein L11 methyltransferase [Chthoniobacterales bacterium]